MMLLFAENHATFARTVCDAFLADHVVQVAPSVAAAQELARSTQFDLVLSDFDLDDGHGTELVAWLRDRSSPIPIVAVSAHDHGNALLLNAGANEVCAKSAFRRIGDLIATLRPLPPRNSLTPPSIDALARVLVSGMSAPIDSEPAFRDLASEILFTERQAWGAFTAGLTRHTELRNLLLCHADDLYEHLVGTRADFDSTTIAVVPPLERALFFRDPT